MLCSMGELEKHGFDEFEIHQYPKGVSLILKCADWITNKELDVALNYARKIAKNKPYRVFIKVKDSLGYKVLEVMDVIDLRLLDSKIKVNGNSFTLGKRLKVVVRE